MAGFEKFKAEVMSRLTKKEHLQDPYFDINDFGRFYQGYCYDLELGKDRLVASYVNRYFEEFNFEP